MGEDIIIIIIQCFVNSNYKYIVQSFDIVLFVSVMLNMMHKTRIKRRLSNVLCQITIFIVLCVGGS